MEPLLDFPGGLSVLGPFCGFSGPFLGRVGAVLRVSRGLFLGSFLGVLGPFVSKGVFGALLGALSPLGPILTL